MIDPTPLYKIAPIFAVALISPGPDFMMISTMALSRGRMAAILAALGITLGSLVYVALCLFGLSILLTKMHGVLMLVRVCGSAYLIYLAVQLWRASFKTQSSWESPVSAPSTRNPFLVGFITNMTNPKAIAFFTSIFTLTLPPDANLATQATIVLMMAFMPIVWFGIVACVLSSPRMRGVYMRFSHWIDRLAGTCLGFFGVRLLLSTQD